MEVQGSFSGKKILIVGGAGFVGSNLCLQLLTHDPELVLIVDNLLSSEFDNLPIDPSVQFIAGSINDSEVLANLPLDLDYVFHLSCYHGNQSSIANPFADHENNTLTSLKLFDHLKTFKNLTKVVYSAAGCAVAEKTYGTAQATTEDAPISLFHDSPYSISKIIGELYGNYYFGRYGLPFVKARFQNVYGPREILGAGAWRGTRHSIWRNVTPTFVYKSMKGEALPLDNQGMGTRDFIFVEDIANGLIACALKGEPGENYNLGTGKETTIKELAEEINRLTGNKTPVNLLPARDWDNSGCRFGSTEKSKMTLGFEAETSLKDGLAKTVEWTNANLELIEKNIKKHQFLESKTSLSL